MTRIWVEDGKVMCCSDLCDKIGCPQNKITPKCQEIESPLKLIAERDRLKKLISIMCPEEECHSVTECEVCPKYGNMEVLG